MPPLAGPTLSHFRFAPVGQALAWLQSADDDGNREDLWLGTWTTERTSLPDACSPAEESPEAPSSEAEKARRERLRLFSPGSRNSTGGQTVRPYASPSTGSPMSRPWKGPSDAPEPGRPSGTSLTSAPGDHRFAYVHDGDLWLGPRGAVERLTEEAADGVVVGLPDFIAAEEMHRQDAFWFSRTAQLAFIKADETPIPETLRFDATEAGIEARRSATPSPGAPTPSSPSVCSPEDHSLRWLPWSDDPEAYLARVTWAPGSDALFLQRQPRDQKTLSLLRLGLDGALRLALEERSESWVNLHDDFRPLASGGALWSAERGGPRQLYDRPRLGEAEERRLTPEGSIVHRVLAVDEEAREVLFEGTLGDPTARQVLRAHFDSSPVEALTEETGWHQGAVAPGGAWMVVLEERPDQPPEATLRDSAGTHRATLTANRLSKPSHAYAPYLSARAIPTLGQLPGEDGQPLYYRLTRPKGDGPFPIILAVYGGPGAQRVTQGWPPLLHQVFVQHGWAVLELDNRGSAGRGEAFERPIYRTFGAVEVRPIAPRRLRRGPLV